jgi:hypothetical protein
VLGKYYQLTGAASNPMTQFITANGSAVAGDLIQISFKVGATLEATSSTGYVQIVNGDGTQDFFSLTGWDKDIPNGSILSTEFTMPTLANTRPGVKVQVRTAAGTLRVGQIGILNLTALGVA